MDSRKLDLIIVGGSAAGVSAAIYAARRQLNFKVVSLDFGGEVANSGKIGNYPGFNEIDGLALTEIFRQQLEHNLVDVELGVKIGEIKKQTDNSFFLIGEKDGQKVSFETKTVLIATGVHPKLLNAQGEGALRGKGVSYCTTCDGPLFRNKTTAVIGGGNSALESALMLKDLCPKVYLLTINDRLAGETIYIEKLKQAQNVEIVYLADTKKFSGTDRLEAIEYTDKKTGQIKKIEVQGAFIHIGLAPNSGFVPQEIKKNQLGEIIVNLLGETSVPGIFAAGDVTDIPYKQVVIAAGQGCAAVLRAIQYIDQNNR